MYFNLRVVRVNIYSEAIVISGKTLAANASREFESHRGQKIYLFLPFTLFRVECEELF